MAQQLDTLQWRNPRACADRIEELQNENVKLRKEQTRSLRRSGQALATDAAAAASAAAAIGSCGGTLPRDLRWAMNRRCTTARWTSFKARDYVAAVEILRSVAAGVSQWCAGGQHAVLAG